MYAYLFLIGLCVGSFLSVLVARLDIKKGILTGRSECPNCQRQLIWKDLIPVLSYVYLRGRCRYCGIRISMFYPVVELITASAFVVYFLFNGPDITLFALYTLSLVALFISLIFFDLKYFILPDKIVFTIIGLSIIYGITIGWLDFKDNLLWGFLLTSFFAIIYLVSRGEWMGFGDVKLVLGIGLTLGYLGLIVTIFSVWTAALYGIALIIFNKAKFKTALPFGSFLSAFTVLFIIFRNVFEEKIQLFSQFIR